MPHGTNAKDLEYFVKYIGMSPMDALLSATREGGKIMMRPHELGQIRENFLADLLLVDGNPLDNLKLITDPARNFVVIMKDGTVYKNLLTPGASSARAQ